MDAELQEAAAAGELDRVMALAGPRPARPSVSWVYPACVAAGREGRRDFFEWLLEAGGPAALGLEAACRAGRLDCARFLWEADGAREAQGDARQLLHVALANGRTEIVRWLCGEGARVDVFAFISACRSGNPELAEWAGAELEEALGDEALDEDDVCDLLGELDHACDRGRRRIAELIAEKLPQAQDGEVVEYRERVLAKYNAL